MSIEYAVASAAAHSPQVDVQAAPIAGAEQELGAFLAAVRQRLGPETARRAGHYWIDAFESASWPSGKSGSAWRRITIAAASRLAQETAPASFLEKSA